MENAVSPRVASGLRAHGHDAVHVRDFSVQSSTDIEIFSRAKAEQRVIASADTDFGTLLAMSHDREPSLILFRRESSRRPELQLSLLLNNLSMLEEPLRAGAIAVLEGTRLRVRALPLGGR